MDVDDELCPDEMYKNETKDLKSLETPKLDCGANPSKKVVEYYTLHYEDYDDEDWAKRWQFFSSLVTIKCINLVFSGIFSVEQNKDLNQKYRLYRL